MLNSFWSNNKFTQNHFFLFYQPVGYESYQTRMNRGINQFMILYNRVSDIFLKLVERLIAKTAYLRG